MRALTRRLFVAIGLAVLMLGTPRAADAASILIVAADIGDYPTNELLARGFTTVDVFNSMSGSPTLAQLSGYDAVLAYTNFEPADAVGLGDVLADYVDAGGQLTLATYAFSNPWAIGGRIATSGYSPLTNLGINGDVSGSLLATNPADPLFNGVNLATLSYFHNGNFAHPGLDPGATLLATDGSGINMIARSANGQVIGFNLFPGVFPDNNGEFYDLLANTLLPAQVPEPAALLLFGTGLAAAVRARRRQR